MVSHYEKLSDQGHCVSMNLKSTMIWCYACDDEVTGVEGTDLARKLIVEITQKLRKNIPSLKPATIVKGTKGIANIGNTCFLAASMQCVSHTVGFQKILRHCPPYSSEELLQPTASQRLVVALRNFLINEWGDPHTNNDNSSGTVNPDELLTCVQRLNSLFHGYQQHDSQEFLRFLLNTVHEELKIPSSASSIVSDIFMGKTCSTVTCLRCKKESKCIEDFYDLSLPIASETFSQDQISQILSSSATVVENVNPSTAPSSTSSWLWSKAKSALGWSSEPRVSVTDCLVQFLRTERLTGSDAYFCEHCKIKTDCLKRMSIRQLPEVLVIHLKRFRHDWGSSKLNKLVSFPVASDLDFSPFTEEPAASSYRLSGIVQHLGSIGSGHYVAYCRHKSTGQWYLFDDSRVSLISNVTSIEQTEAYVLFFQRVPSSSVIKERDHLKSSQISLQPTALLPRKWIAQVKTMARVPPLVSDEFVCPHQHPSTSCPVHAKTLFVSVSSDYAERVKKLYAQPNKREVSPVSLEPCKVCASYLLAYNNRLSMEHKLVTKLDTKDIPEGEKWYFIDSAWVAAWRQYLKHGPIADSNKGCSPGPVKTKKLAEKSKDEISKLKITSDFIAVNENVWTVFVHCHGSDGPALTGATLDILECAQDHGRTEIPKEFIGEDEWKRMGHEFVHLQRGTNVII
jgi:ubiquitin C-terminal hydrolase